MNRIGRRACRIGIAAVFGFLMGASAWGGAPTPFAGALPKVWEADWGLPDTRDYFGKALMEGVEGRCDWLLELTSEPHFDAEWARMEALGEMYDRGICVPFDPAAALRAFEQGAAISFVGKTAIIPWKYLHGHGVRADAAKARELFKAYFVRHSVSSYTPGETEERERKWLKDRPIPREFEKGLTWLRVLAEDRKRKLELARNLIQGTGTYYDVTPLPRDRYSAFLMLYFMSSTEPEAGYLLGSEFLKGSFDELGKKSLPSIAKYAFESAASCQHVDAMVEFARHLEVGGKGIEPNRIKAYILYRAASRLGADVASEVRRLERDHPFYIEIGDTFVEKALKPDESCPIGTN